MEENQKVLQVGNFLTAISVSDEKISGEVIKILNNTVVVQNNSGKTELVKKQVINDLGYSLPPLDKKKGTYYE